ncbi:MAG: CoA pyrophosphatase [Gammaproteobacteria bacterium]|nr:CoA pyrophosphatase [Gammaproteobacteria bacterium]MYH86500.1 CoA pyrophosphatase [Gammaproteobacteria bacterium]MYK04432.1 CoA pyrophosphatase [Gammaproteobacteria bacterium]
MDDVYRRPLLRRPTGAGLHRRNLEFPIVNPAFESLLALFAAPAEERLAPISHPARLGPGSASLREAAVLIPVSRPGDAASNVVLTVRSENLRSHAGQISLPGGSIESGDADLAAAALREAEEEIGLPREQVKVIGELGPMALPSGFLVTPVIGLIPPGLEFTACPREVADIFQTPLDLILNPEAYVRSSYIHAGVKRSTLELHCEDYRIWGATAAILHRLAVLAAG